MLGELRLPLEQHHPGAALGQFGRRTHPGDAAADDDDVDQMQRSALVLRMGRIFARLGRPHAGRRTWGDAGPRRPPLDDGRGARWLASLCHPGLAAEVFS
ncbi:MAG: hypothetical protein R2749_16570 [Acidimicrobiales bacterium]